MPDINDEFDNLDYWRLCEELTIHQAALLVAGVDPSSTEGANCHNWSIDQRPPKYEAARNALINALRREQIVGEIVPDHDTDLNGRWYSVEGTISIHSLVIVDSLKLWLESRGFKTGFFFPSRTESVDYLDRNNSRYAPKLAAAVRAWQAVTDPGKKSPKGALEKWLREHAAEFGLVDEEDGSPINMAIEECSKVANWKQGGGAPKTPGD